MIRTRFVIAGLSLSLLMTGYPSEAQPDNNAASPDTQVASASKAVDPALQTALRQAIASYMKQQGATPDASHRFFADYIDLNGDKALDALVTFSSSYWCGTGGCTMLVFQGQNNKTFRLVSESSLVNPPLTVSETKTNGWRDLIVDVSGGGAAPKKVALKYDGKKYPDNPSDQPSIPANTPIKGTVLFPEGSKPQTLTGATGQKPPPVVFACNNSTKEIVATFTEGSFSGKGRASGAVFSGGRQADASLDFNQNGFNLGLSVPPGTGAQVLYLGTINRLRGTNSDNPNSFVLEGRVESFASSTNSSRMIDTDGFCRIEVSDARITSVSCSANAPSSSTRFTGMSQF